MLSLSPLRYILRTIRLPIRLHTTDRSTNHLPNAERCRSCGHRAWVLHARAGLDSAAAGRTQRPPCMSCHDPLSSTGDGVTVPARPDMSGGSYSDLGECGI